MLQGEHSAILSTFIKLPFAIKTLRSIFEWLLKTSFTVTILFGLITCDPLICKIHYPKFNVSIQKEESIRARVKIGTCPAPQKLLAFIENSIITMYFCMDNSVDSDQLQDNSRFGPTL